MTDDAISVGIQWNRLISIVDEMISALVRTSFSTNVRESYDLSCIIFDSRGKSIAQGTYSSPGFTGTAPLTLAHMLEVFPPETLAPGDVVMTNDPWMGTGHLFDVSVMQPAFRQGRLIGYIMSVTHLPDIGGGGFSATAREVYEEGLRFPVCKLVRAGKVDEFILSLLRFNVRVPEQTIGDLMANVTCTSVGARLVVEFMDEYALESIEPLADAIIAFSERALREEIAKIPDGVYRHRLEIEGYDAPVSLACAVSITGDEASIDFTGSGPPVGAAINVPLCYTKAMALYAIKCLTTTKIPNNQGSITPIRIAAPEDCILNATPPFPTGGRHIVGHFVVPLIFGALAEVMPHRIQADCGMLNLINVQGRTREGEGVSSIFFASGGFGALKDIDGRSACPGPSNITGTPIEVWENLTGTFVKSKALLMDSGGPGQFRGGLGQRIEIRNDSGQPMKVSCLSARTEYPPIGVLGGKPGRKRSVHVNGEVVHSMGRYILEPGDSLVTFEAGGGGYGDPRDRDPQSIRADVESGYVSPEAAALEYGAGR